MSAASLALAPGSLATLRPAGHQPHVLHGETMSWVEKNCYIDAFIEVVHALSLDPVAMLPVTAAVDFVGDQWTFFKPSHDELRSLYGLDVQELIVWRPLVAHLLEHLPDGRLVATEADAFWLPDVAATDYRRHHAKTSIVIAQVDTSERTLGYFHNTGFHTLQGEDFDRLIDASTGQMPLYAETIACGRMVDRSPGELRSMSLANLRRHVDWRAQADPGNRFRAALRRQWQAVTESGLTAYHAWAFANLRQWGAASELLAQHLRWQGDGWAGSAAPFERVSSVCKSLVLKGARAANSKRAFDPPELEAAAADWTAGMVALDEALPR